MCLLFETICIINGKVQNISFHNKRMNKSRFELFNSVKTINIQDIICIHLPFCSGVVKCKIVYNDEIIDVAFEKYRKREIESFTLIYSPGIEYNHKYCNRNSIEKLKVGLQNNEEIIIVIDNMIKDTSFSNIVFFDGTIWLTPANPLLKGTKREFLIKSNKIKESCIYVNDLKKFKYFKLINAMLDFETEKLYSVEVIKRRN